MSSDATAVEQRRTSDPKRTVAPTAPPAAAPAASTPAQPAAGAADAAANGATAAPGGPGTQGLAAALAQAPDAGGAADTRKNKDASNQIDRQLEDDSKKFKKECKILLLGGCTVQNVRLTDRIWRVWQVDHCQADEDYSSERLLQGGAHAVQEHCVSVSDRSIR